MSDVALLVLFAIHLVAFGALGLRRRQLKYVRLVLLFSALVAHYALRLTGYGSLTLGPWAVTSLLRAFAYGLAAWSVIELLRSRRRRSGASA